MTEPTQASLDEAAKAAGYICWVQAKRHAEARAAASIVAKPDPLVEILMGEDWPTENTETVGAKFRAALAARGLEIVEKKS